MSIAKNLRANFYAPRTAQHVDELRCRAVAGGGEVKSANVLVWPTSLARKSSRKAHTQPTRHITRFMPSVAAAACPTRRAA